MLAFPEIWVYSCQSAAALEPFVPAHSACPRWAPDRIHINTLLLGSTSWLIVID